MHEVNIRVRLLHQCHVDKHYHLQRPSPIISSPLHHALSLQWYSCILPHLCLWSQLCWLGHWALVGPAARQMVSVLRCVTKMTTTSKCQLKRVPLPLPPSHPQPISLWGRGQQKWYHFRLSLWQPLHIYHNHLVTMVTHKLTWAIRCSNVLAAWMNFTRNKRGQTTLTKLW